MEDIDVDWITGNLYGVAYTGHVIVCELRAAEKAGSPSLNCQTLLSDQGNLWGIAVNPNAG